MKIEDRGYTLLEAAKMVLEHVEDEELTRIDNGCTLCFSYRAMLREAIEREEVAFNAMKESRDYWKDAAEKENKKLLDKINQVAELERQLSRTFI